MRPSPNARVMLAGTLPAASCWQYKMLQIWRSWFHRRGRFSECLLSGRMGLGPPLPGFPQSFEKHGRSGSGPLFSLMRLWGVVRRLWSPWFNGLLLWQDGRGLSGGYRPKPESLNIYYILDSQKACIPSVCVSCCKQGFPWPVGSPWWVPSW